MQQQNDPTPRLHANPPRTAVRLACAGLVLALAALSAAAYIHLPPMQLPSLCKDTRQIRLLKIEKLDKDKGIIIFEVAQSLKGEKSSVTRIRHVIRTDSAGAKPVLDWAEPGKQAVMFSVTSRLGKWAEQCAFVFIDDYCYSVSSNTEGEQWLMLRGEPGMSACYYGSVEQLQALVKEILAGKEVKVPIKDLDVKENSDKRTKEITDVMVQNEKTHQAPTQGVAETATSNSGPGESRSSASGSESPWRNALWIGVVVAAGVAVAWVGRRTLRKRR